MENPRIDSTQSDGYELDVRKIFNAVIQNKKRFIRNAGVAIVLWAVTFLVYAFITYTPATYYSLVLGLNFPQAAQGKYPNGSTLSASDLVSNTVLEKVWTENNLEQKGVKLIDFQKSLTSTPYSGEINFIDLKYKGMLSQKNLTRSDIEKIETEYRNEIQAASSKNLKLTLNAQYGKYDNSLASKLLNDVANAWSNTAKVKLGASRAPVLDGLPFNEEMKSSSPYVVVTYLNDIVFRLESVLNLMRQDPNSDSYRDPLSGKNLTATLTTIQDISKYKIDELDAFIAINKKPTDWELLQTQYRLKELQESKSTLEQKADIYQKSLVDYYKSSSYSAASPANEVKSRFTGGGDSTGVQINGDAISKLLALSAESKDADYRQEMTNSRVDILVQANDLNRQIKKLERRISAAGNKSNTNFSEISKIEYLDLLNKAWSELAKSIDTVTRIQSIAQKDFISDSGFLFTVINQPPPYSPYKDSLKFLALLSLFGAIAISLMFTSLQIYASRKLQGSSK